MVGAFRAQVERAQRQGDSYFAALLPEEHITRALEEARALWKGIVYTPVVTVRTFLCQCLSEDHSCRDAVTENVADRVAQGNAPCSAATGGYCRAREKLSEDAIHQLVRQTGKEVEEEGGEELLWHGRKVRAVDGSTVTMADTPANQAEYPQQKNQARGCGFPIARILTIFSLSVGTVLEAAIGKYKGKQTGENSMLRALLDVFEEGDILLEDRYFGGWCDIALARRRGLDVVVRKHQLRPTDFRTGRRLGKKDHIISLPRVSRPEWMSLEQYRELPKELEVREVFVRVEPRGFRTETLVVMTTLLDAEEYPSEEIALLFRQRWQAELNLRSLKTVMKMDHLRCKTPHRVHNEFYMHLLAYNLIRRAMTAAALASGRSPWEMSFKGTLQTLSRFLPRLLTCVDLALWYDVLLRAIATHIVGNRPDRIEPRLVKRRPKTYKHLREPRENYRKLMRGRG